jgi:hypothetical protein
VCTLEEPVSVFRSGPDPHLAAQGDDSGIRSRSLNCLSPPAPSTSATGDGVIDAELAPETVLRSFFARRLEYQRALEFDALDLGQRRVDFRCAIEWRHRARSIRRASPEAESLTIDSEPAATDGEPE